MTLLALAAVVAVAPLEIIAQTNSWTSVRAVPKGTEVILERKNDENVLGYVTSVSDDTIAITSDDGSFFVGRANVSKVFYAVPKNTKRHMNRGALIGMVVGAIVVTAIAGEPEGQEMPGLGGLFAGGAIGTYIGKKNGEGKKKGELIYSAR